MAYRAIRKEQLAGQLLALWPRGGLTGCVCRIHVRLLGWRCLSTHTHRRVAFSIGVNAADTCSC